MIETQLGYKYIGKDIEVVYLPEDDNYWIRLSQDPPEEDVQSGSATMAMRIREDADDIVTILISLKEDAKERIENIDKALKAIEDIEAMRSKEAK